MEPANDLAIATQDQHVNVAALTAGIDTLCQDIRTLAGGVQSLVHMLAKEYEQPDMVIGCNLSPGQEITLHKQGRRYLYIFAANSVSVTFVINGIAYDSTLAIGWTAPYVPEGTILRLSSGQTGSHPFVVKLTNWQQTGTAI